MTRGDVEFLREGYAALARGDMETFTALARERLAPDFEFHHVWDGGVFRGFEGTMEWIADTRETWDDYSQEVAEIVEAGDAVVVVVELSARGGAGGCGGRGRLRPRRPSELDALPSGPSSSAKQPFG